MLASIVLTYRGWVAPCSSPLSCPLLPAPYLLISLLLISSSPYSSSPHLLKKKREWPYKPGSVPRRLRYSPYSFLRGACHLSTTQVTLRLQRSTLHRSYLTASSGGQPWHGDGIHELAASRRYSSPITRRLVVSYTTFSPLPRKRGGRFLLPAPIVANSFYFRKWSALCCPDFPLEYFYSSGRARPLLGGQR